MKRLAVFVDAGYVWVQFCNLLGATGRDSVLVDYEKFKEEFQRKIQELFPNKELLRIYWYDGLYNFQPSQFNQNLSMIDGFKLRYGTVNNVGQQKGVDGLIISDLISLSQYRAISDALLISGDADLAPGVVAAQALGIKVHRLDVGSTDATSRILKSEVDANYLWDSSDITKFIHPKDECQKREFQAEKRDGLKKTIKDMVEGLTTDQRLDIATSDSVAVEYDKQLLYLGRKFYNRYLDELEKRDIRLIFRDCCSEIFDIPENRNTQLHACGNVNNAILNNQANAESEKIKIRLQEVIDKFYQALTEEEKSYIKESAEGIPKVIDNKMLAMARSILGRYLSDAERVEIREKIIALCNTEA